MEKADVVAAVCYLPYTHDFAGKGEPVKRVRFGLALISFHVERAVAREGIDVPSGFDHMQGSHTRGELRGAVACHNPCRTRK